MPQCWNVQNNVREPCVWSFTLLFSWLDYLHTEGNLFLFELTFLQLSHMCDRGETVDQSNHWFHSDDNSGPHQSWPTRCDFPRTISGKAHSDFDFLRALCYAFGLVQLNFHAFLVVFSFTHSHKHVRYKWKLALQQQLLLIFLCPTISSQTNYRKALTVSQTIRNYPISQHNIYQRDPRVW